MAPKPGCRVEVGPLLRRFFYSVVDESGFDPSDSKRKCEKWLNFEYVLRVDL